MREPTQKLLVAAELLDRALATYFEGKYYFAALHLAGAAEEILGVYVSRLGEDSSYKALRDGAVRISSFLSGGKESSAREIEAIMNYAKNRTKHLNKSGDDDVCFDPASETLNLLDLAVSNYYKLMNGFNLPETELVDRFNKEISGRGMTP
ncbi:hypothetical protein DXT77_18355 [Pseudomonas sp. 91RF]|jgi:hypothetical protein|uniref:hypothetical protein n=1 Tax=Pseudomonas sp. 91RF TaxID=2292261 RepID=UPI000E66681B|nr:hypothetical protein [Pseudomonas sp. 91RF]RIJ09102.1 hypothetical protein DXT77_18355 [Pseudomonas sp. 91RF]